MNEKNGNGLLEFKGNQTEYPSQQVQKLLSADTKERFLV
jgi:hypothetical protein